jgi:tRNA-binding EMAP/Myf-like protein
MIAGVMSQGMLLAADVNGKPSWLIVKDAPVGAKII